MEPKDIPAVPCWPSDSKCTTGRVTGAPWGIELGPRRTKGRCDRCHNHGITTIIRGEKHFCLFQACKCHNCAFFSEPHRPLSVGTSLKREQSAGLKRHAAQGIIKTMATAPKKLAIEADDVPAGKETSVAKPEARPCWTPQEEGSPGPLLFTRPLDTAALLYAAAALEQLSRCNGEQLGTEILPGMCSNLIMQPCATSDPLLPQPQVPNASSDQAAALEWQRKLEAAEALLALKNSAWAPSEPASLHPTCSLPAAPAGERGLLSDSPSLGPRPASSVSLPIGHLGCISLLT